MPWLALSCEGFFAAVAVIPSLRAGFRYSLDTGRSNKSFLTSIPIIGIGLEWTKLFAPRMRETTPPQSGKARSIKHARGNVTQFQTNDACNLHGLQRARSILLGHAVYARLANGDAFTTA
jgi:hypothetical protein